MTIIRKSIPDGVLLRVKPFQKPNKNAACEIMARVTSSQGTRRDAQFIVCNLNNLMSLTDVRILMTALRSLTEKVEVVKEEVQETARKKTSRKKAAVKRPKKKAAKKKAAKKTKKRA